MKARVLQSVVTMLFVFALMPALCRAQAEIDPDHFDGPSTALTVAKMATSNQTTWQAYGSFFLPVEVTCAGVNLSPGYYSLSVRQSGKRDVVRLTRIVNGARAQAFEMTATPRLGAKGPSGLVVDHVNQRKTLTAIRLQQPGVTLLLQPGKELAISLNAELIPFSYATSQALPASGE